MEQIKLLVLGQNFTEGLYKITNIEPNLFKRQTKKKYFDGPNWNKQVHLRKPSKNILYFT